MSFDDIEFDITAEDWGREQKRPYVRHVPTVMELHHSVIDAADFSAASHAERIESIHMAKGWNGAFYNVGVHPTTGEIVELRGVGNQSTGLAKDALTVVLFGNHHSYDGHPTPDQISDAGMASLLYIAGLAPNPGGLRGHRERPYATACPGSYAMEHFVLPYREGTLTAPPPPVPPTQKVYPMPYAMGRHKDGKTMYALFKGGVVRAIGPAEKAYLDTKKIKILITESDVEEKHWKAAAANQRS